MIYHLLVLLRAAGVPLADDGAAGTPHRAIGFAGKGVAGAGQVTSDERKLEPITISPRPNGNPSPGADEP